MGDRKVWVPFPANNQPAAEPVRESVSISPEPAAPRVRALFPDAQHTHLEQSASTLPAPMFAGMTIRCRPAITPADIQLTSPEESDHTVIAKAVDIVLMTNLDLMHLDEFGQFGVEPQEKAAPLANELWQIANSSALRSALDLTQRIANVIAVSEIPVTEKHWYEFRKKEAQPATRSLEDRVGEVQELSAALSKALKQLPDLALQAKNLAAQLKAVAIDVRIVLASARCILSLLKAKSSQPESIDLLERRIESLSITQLTLLQEQAQLQLIAKNLTYHTRIVMDTNVNMVPLWCAKCSMPNLSQEGPATTALMSQIVQKLRGADGNV